MPETSVHDQAAFLYDQCAEIAVAQTGDRWDVFDGADGPHVMSVTTEVLTHLDDNYDLPVRLVDGSDWR